jgi:O-methyltransferase domain
MLARTLLAAHAHLRATLFDLPQVVASVELAARLTIVPGNVFDDPVPGADACILFADHPRLARRRGGADPPPVRRGQTDPVRRGRPARATVGRRRELRPVHAHAHGRSSADRGRVPAARGVGRLGALVLTAARDRQRAGRAAGRLTSFVAWTRDRQPRPRTPGRPSRSASEPSAPAPGHPYLRLPLQFSSRSNRGCLRY